MSESRDYLELTFKSINCFADDGKLDVDELNGLVDVALRDGVVDENEKRVLSNIISRLNDKDLDQTMIQRVSEIKSKFGL